MPLVDLSTISTIAVAVAVAELSTRGDIQERTPFLPIRSVMQIAAQRPVPPPLLARKAAEICMDSKADDVIVLDLHGVTDMTDYFVVATGTSDTHVRSVAQHVIDELGKQGHRAASTEGLQQGRWVLLDYVDFVVHVFHPSSRSFYQLERLWGDAPMLAVSP